MATPAERRDMDDATHETWLPIPGYEGFYDVSDLGRVRSLPRQGIRSRHSTVILRPMLRHGYATVYLMRDGSRTTCYVHRLVLLAFVGPCPPGQETRHGPGGKSDNRLANLCWGTPPENWADKVRDGAANVGILRGEAKPTAKLTWAIAADCRRRYAAGESQAARAREFGVHKTAVQQVVTGKTWASP